MAPRTAELMAQELGESPEWAAAQVREFAEIARNYVV